LSVFGFSKTGKVWGLNRGITMRMIDWWIDRAGPRPYLLEIRQSYDHGYNHGDLTKVADSDKAELRDLVQSMLDAGYENKLVADATQVPRVRESLIELQGLLNGELEGTPFHQSAGSA